MRFSFPLLAAAALLGQSFLISAQPELASWLINEDGATGQYWGAGQLIQMQDECDVQLVQYSEDNVYVQAHGIPRYATAPFPDGNPSIPAAQDYLFQIPRNPQEGPTGGTTTGLGHTGVLINGVVIFNAQDAFSYNNQGIWHQNGGFFENDGFDCAKGHPAMGQYHHHQVPTRFDDSLEPTSDVCSDFPSDALFTLDPGQHSPLIGFAFDGYPIYGPFGFASADGSGGVVRMETSWQLREIEVRQTLSDGTALAPNQYGPDVGELVTPAIPPGAAPVAAVLGAYIEDHEYVEGSGHLDEFNGRVAVTPEYPEGTYAYYATVDEDYNAQYPYFFPAYRGVVETDNFGGGSGPGGGGGTNVTIDEEVQTWTGGVSEMVAIAGGAPFFAYPNPASRGDVVRFSGRLPDGVVVHDAAGRKVDCWGAAMLQAGVSLLGLPPGIYSCQALKGGPRILLVVEP